MSNDDPDAVEYVTPSKSYLRRRLQQMDPYDFEEFIADVWVHLGWNTRTVGKPGDRGIDVIAKQGDEKQLIQAKRYGPNTTVGSPEIQQYASLRIQEDGVDKVTIVTTGEFTRQAEDLAPELDVLLIDGEDLLGILDEIEAFEVFAKHFDDIEVGEPEHPADEEDGSGDGAFRPDTFMVGRVTPTRNPSGPGLLGFFDRTLGEGSGKNRRRVGQSREGQTTFNKEVYIRSMTVGVTTLGPIEPATRDAVADYRDEHDHPNYNAAVKALLEEVDADA